MSEKLRTTLILGTFWLLVIAGGWYFVHFRMSKQVEQLTETEKKVSEDLNLNEELVASLPKINQELQESKYRWERRRKYIPQEEESHETYAYMDDILSKQRTTFDFDYFATEEVDSGGVHYSNYHVLGEARFIDLYRFIWYLEHLPRYMRLNSLELSEETVERKGFDAAKHWVRFDMNLSALCTSRPGFDQVVYASTMNPPASKHDPFQPPVKVVRKIPANDRGLPNVYESTLRALTPTEVYLTDQKGELKVLGLGDEVYLGRVKEILPDENRVVFSLDQLYPPRQVSLTIKAGK